MGYNSTYTVKDLMGALSEMDPQAPVMVEFSLCGHLNIVLLE